MTDPNAAPKERSAAGSRWEWAAAGASLLLVLGAIGFLGYEALEGQDTPPRISVEVDSVVRAGDGWLVEFRAVNSGQVTAAALRVEGTLKRGESTVESSEVTLTYVPGESSRAAGLYFSEDPRRHALEIRPTGYERP